MDHVLQRHQAPLRRHLRSVQRLRRLPLRGGQVLRPPRRPALERLGLAARHLVSLAAGGERARQPRGERLVGAAPLAPLLGQPSRVGVGEHGLAEAAEDLRQLGEPLAGAPQRRHQLPRLLDDPPLLHQRRQGQDDAGEEAVEIEVAEVRRLCLVLVEAAAEIVIGEREMDERGIDLAVDADLAAEVGADQRRASGAPDHLVVDQQRPSHRLGGAAARDLDHQVPHRELPAGEALPLDHPLLRGRSLVALPVAELRAADHPHPHHLRVLRHLARILAPLAAELVDDDLLERSPRPSLPAAPLRGVRSPNRRRRSS